MGVSRVRRSCGASAVRSRTWEVPQSAPRGPSSPPLANLLHAELALSLGRCPLDQEIEVYTQKTWDVFTPDLCPVSVPPVHGHGPGEATSGQSRETAGCHRVLMGHAAMVVLSAGPEARAHRALWTVLQP